MRTHDLKCWPAPFRDVRYGRKTYEIRINDRGFAVGDVLLLREWDPASEEYTGLSDTYAVVHLTEGGQWGLPSNLCVMGIRPAGATRPW